jgi:hypothetical protein
MASVRILAWIALALPLAAGAQEIHSRAVVAAEPGYYLDTLRICSERNDTLWDRKAMIEQDRLLLEREDTAIARMRAEIEERWQSLDRRDAEAVAAYNARSTEFNRWVEAHNKRVEELNAAAELLNTNSRLLVTYCDNLYVTR